MFVVVVVRLLLFYFVVLLTLLILLFSLLPLSIVIIFCRKNEGKKKKLEMNEMTGKIIHSLHQLKQVQPQSATEIRWNREDNLELFVETEVILRPSADTTRCVLRLPMSQRLKRTLRLSDFLSGWGIWTEPWITCYRPHSSVTERGGVPEPKLIHYIAISVSQLSTYDLASWPATANDE